MRRPMAVVVIESGLSAERGERSDPKAMVRKLGEERQAFDLRCLGCLGCVVQCMHTKPQQRYAGVTTGVGQCNHSGETLETSEAYADVPTRV
jgi:hypothetical protein